MVFKQEHVTIMQYVHFVKHPINLWNCAWGMCFLLIEVVSFHTTPHHEAMPMDTGMFWLFLHLGWLYLLYFFLGAVGLVLVVKLVPKFCDKLALFVCDLNILWPTYACALNRKMVTEASFPEHQREMFPCGYNANMW